MGVTEAGADSCGRQVVGNVQWRDETEIIDCHCSHWTPAGHFPGMLKKKKKNIVIYFIGRTWLNDYLLN